MSQSETSNNLSSPVSLELFSGFPDFGSLPSQDSFRNYNLDGISEVTITCYSTTLSNRAEGNAP